MPFRHGDRLIANKPDLADAIGALGWVADGVDDSERYALLRLIQIAASNETTARALLAMEWVADEPSDDELSTLGRFEILSRDGSDAAIKALALPWVADGISRAEASVIRSMGSIAYRSAAAAEIVIALHWVADSVSDTEADAVYNLSGMDVDAAIRVMDMPFLQTLEGADMAALDSLGLMDADQLADILSRPMLKDGITDDEAPIVSMLYGALEDAPDLVDTLLAPEATIVERRTVDLPLAGEVELAIVRTRPGARRSIGLLENAVREAENLMGEPLPTRYVGLLYEDVLGPWAGANFGTHIAIGTRYDVDETVSPPT